MDIALLCQLLMNGLLVGGTYVLVASGLTLIMGVARILNIAHGEFYLLGAYAFVFLYGVFHLNWILALIGSALFVAIIATICHLLIFKHLLGNFFATMCATIGLLIVLNQSVVVAAGERDYFVMPIFRGTLIIGGVTLPYDKLVVLGLSLLVMLGLYGFLNTKLGKALTATSMDSEAAALLGINPTITFAIAVAVGSALAGIAGGIMAPIVGANRHLSNIILLTMLIVLVAGHGSMKGAVIIGLLVGLVESFGYQFLGTWYLLFLFIILGIIIYFRPEGLFGEAPPEV